MPEGTGSTPADKVADAYAGLASGLVELAESIRLGQRPATEPGAGAMPAEVVPVLPVATVPPERDSLVKRTLAASARTAIGIAAVPTIFHLVFALFPPARPSFAAIP